MQKWINKKLLWKSTLNRNTKNCLMTIFSFKFKFIHIFSMKHHIHSLLYRPAQILQWNGRIGFLSRQGRLEINSFHIIRSTLEPKKHIFWIEINKFPFPPLQSIEAKAWVLWNSAQNAPGHRPGWTTILQCTIPAYGCQRWRNVAHFPYCRPESTSWRGKILLLTFYVETW